MYQKIISGAVYGIDSYLVEVEVNVSEGLPCMELVGFLSSEVKEARERVRVALHNCGNSIPIKRVTVNLSPANIKKVGSSYDLPIACGIYATKNNIADFWQNQVLITGELGLDGEVRAVKGILPIVLEAKDKNLKACIIPRENGEEGCLVNQISIFPVAHLKEAMLLLSAKNLSEANQIFEQIVKERKEHQFADIKNVEVKNSKENKGKGIDEEKSFSNIHGQEFVKRAAVIAAAGFHNLLLIGPPGAGKTMIAGAIPGILPKLSETDSLEVSKIYSISGKLSDKKLIDSPPFVNPHHTISAYALAGGGAIPKPGALSLAHKGILFLDELPEFKRNVLDIMRQPLEEGYIRIDRNAGSFIYPSEILLVAAMNPCPCGYYPDARRCKCSSHEVKRYLSHVSGPLLDRIDLCVHVTEVKIKDLTRSVIFGEETDKSSDEIMIRQVKEARNMQKRRYGDTAYMPNRKIGGKHIENDCKLEDTALKFISEIFEIRNMSARSYHSVLRVSRTIADIEGSEQINREHVEEAVSYTQAKELFQIQV